MSVVTRCGAVCLLVGLLAGASPVRAQSETSGSSWTDPPVHGSAASETPAAAPAKPVEAKSSLKASAPAETARNAGAPPAAATPAERAAARLGVKPVEASARATQTRRAAVRPRMVEQPLVVARRPGRLVDRPLRRMAQRPMRRALRSYAFVPESRPYGRDARSTWSGRRLAGWGGLVEDSPSSRIAQARAAGYTVMRMRTYEYPDGSRVQRLSPLDDGFGDLD